MDLKLFHMGDIKQLNVEQVKTTEDFINSLMYTVIATNNPQTGARISNLNNMPGQKLDKLYFATDSASKKAANIKADPRCELMYTNGNSQLMLSGKAMVIEDKAVKNAKWIDFMYDHFPDGPEGEQFCLIEFTSESARIMLAPEAEFENVKVDLFPVVGIAVKTCNLKGQSAADIGALWGRFWNENIIAKIPGIVNNDIYCIYTEYEGDYTQPYTCLIGCRTNSLDNIPEGMKGIMVEQGEYAKMATRGNLNENYIANEWIKVWSAKINRKYRTDYEYYGAGAANMEDAQVDIFVGLV